MAHLLVGLGKLAARRGKRALALALLALVAIGGLAAGAGGGFADDVSTPGVDSQRASDLLEDRFPQAAGDDATVVFAVRDGSLSRPDRKAAIDRLRREVADQPDVTTVSRLERSREGRIGYVTVLYSAKAEDVDERARDRLEVAGGRRCWKESKRPFAAP